MKELIITLALYALAIAITATGPFGIAFVAVWLGIGLYMVANSRSRGLWADVSFLVTWPIYVALER